MKKDEELVTKEEARNAVRHVFGQGLVAVLAAIDALEPAPGRSEAEIRRAVTYFRTCRIPFDPGVVAQVLEYASGIEKNPEPCIRKLFQPPACADESDPTPRGKDEKTG